MTTRWVSPEAQREAGLNTAHLTDPQVRTPSWPPWPDEASMLTQQPLAFVAELLACDGFRCLMNLGSQVQVKWLRRKKCAVWKKCLSESYSKVNSSSLFGFGGSPGTWPVAQTLSVTLAPRNVCTSGTRIFPLSICMWETSYIWSNSWIFRNLKKKTGNISLGWSNSFSFLGMILGGMSLFLWVLQLSPDQKEEIKSSYSLIFH